MVYHPGYSHAEFLLDPAWQDVLLGAVEGLLAQGQGEEEGARESEQRSRMAAAAASAGGGHADAAGMEGPGEGACGVERWKRFLEAVAIAAGQRGSSCDRDTGTCAGR